MLLIQDVHVVIGREELPLDDMYRREFAPRVAEDPGTRLVAFFWAPHGAGEGYEAVTLTALDGVDALERHQERLATGDLAESWSALEGKQRHTDSSLHVLEDWSPLAARDLSSFATGEEPTAIFRLDTFSVPGELDTTLASLRDQCVAIASDATVAPVACWSPFLGELDRPVVSVLGRVGSDDALRRAFSEPGAEWSGVLEAPGARRITRLLRSTAWSPIH